LKLRLQKIDDVTRPDHWYLTPADECYYFCDYTAGAGFDFTPSNSFILHLKKLVWRRGLADYPHKGRAIEQATLLLRDVFEDSFYATATFAPIPPSKSESNTEYDDRMWRIVLGVCRGKGGDPRRLIVQTASYATSRSNIDGHQMRPEDLLAIYRIDKPQPPRLTVCLFDDILATGCHFKAAKQLIKSEFPAVNCIGIFLARQAVSSSAKV
jgi:hypothetical protein